MAGNYTGKFRRRAEEHVLKDYGLTILVAVLLALLIRFFGVEAYRIPTSTMKPTLESGDTIFVGKWQFGLRFPLLGNRINTGHLPTRGEVVLYAPPEEPKRDVIKRVIGLSGETVEVKQGRVLINGKVLPVDLLAHSTCGSETLPEGNRHGTCWEPPLLENFGPEKVPQNAVFAMSDMRSGSSVDALKSHAYALIPASALKGKALWIWLSIQPQGLGHNSWFPQFRFERMFRRIE